jgi:BTB/POZ domain
MSVKRTSSQHSSSVLNVTWSSSAQVMQANFFKFLERKAFSDCVLEAEGRLIYAHRLVLASSSLYFEVTRYLRCDKQNHKSSSPFRQKLFTSGEKHSVIHLKGISYMNLCLIMKYAYTGEASMAENRLQSFLQAAKTLKMFGLMEDYENHQKLSKRKRKKKPKEKSQVTESSRKRRASDPPAEMEPKRLRPKEKPNSRKRIARENDPPAIARKQPRLVDLRSRREEFSYENE